MAHPVGERLRCDDCGAEIVFEKACTCPAKDPKSHANVCCGKEMKRVESGAKTASPPAG